MPEEQNTAPPGMQTLKQLAEYMHFGKHVYPILVSQLKVQLTNTSLGRMLTRYDILITSTEVVFMNREENGEDRIVRFEDVPEDKRWQEMLSEYRFGRLPRKKRR